MVRTLTRSHIPPVVFMSVFFGTNLVASRFCLGQFHPLGLVAIRLSLAAILTAALSLIRHGRMPQGATIWRDGAVVGVFATAIPMTAFVSALQYQSAGVTALCISLTPIAAMTFAHFLLPDDRLTPRKSLGALISVSGVALLLAGGETGLGEFHWEGFALIAIGVVSNGFGIVHIRRRLTSERSLEIAAVRLLVGAAVAALVSAFAGGFDLSRVKWSGLAAVAYGVVFGTIVAFLLYTFVSVRFGPTKATQQEYLVPVVATIVGALLLGEQVSALMVFGMVAVIAGIVTATTGRRGNVAFGSQQLHGSPRPSAPRER